MFSTRRLQKVNISFILLGEDLRIYFKSKERLCVLGRARGRACTVYYKIGNLGNDDDTGSKKLTYNKKAIALFQTLSILFHFVQFLSVREFLWS